MQIEELFTCVCIKLL